MKELQSRKNLLQAHDKQVKFAGSRQDVYIDKDTGELWVGAKHSPSHFERLYINARELNLSVF